MQPCAVCGGQGVNEAGYCLQCGTYRGVDPAQSPYPMSAPPYPVSPTPPPAAYPVVVPPPPPPPKRSSLGLILVLSATLLVLIVAITVVLVVKSGDDSPPDNVADPTDVVTSDTNDGDDNPSGVDPCVVGSWTVTQHSEDVELDDIGTVRFTGGENSEITLTADGKGTTEYHDGTTYTGQLDNGTTIELILSGTVTYDFQAHDARVTFSNLSADGRIVVKVDGTEVDSAALEGSEDPANYSCTGDRLSEYTDKYRVDLDRQT